MDFVGIDLAWTPRKTSAVTVARGDANGVTLAAWEDDLRGADQVAAYLEEVVGPGDALVAMDAPLAIPNEFGMRPCDRIVASVFRPYHAGVHPVNRSNLSRYQGFQGEELARLLVRRGYAHAIRLNPRKPVRALLETYPHAASVVLFGLEERLAYKARGRSRPWDLRKKALEEYCDHLRRLSCAEPPMYVEGRILSIDLENLRPGLRKGYEDLLDSILCAYVAYYYWFWGPSRCMVIGSVEEGYLVLPVDERVQGKLREAAGSGQ